jgi:GAF domain-containing protein
MKKNKELLESIQNLKLQSEDFKSFLNALVKMLRAERPHFNWVGIYWLKDNELILGPYVGKPTPHTRIALNKGICGAAASQGKTIIVDDVNADSRYLACTLETKSEIVVPIIAGDRILGEIDIDSDTPAAFSGDDKELLEAVAKLVADYLLQSREADIGAA